MFFKVISAPTVKSIQKYDFVNISILLAFQKQLFEAQADKYDLYLCWQLLWRTLPPAAQSLELPALKHITENQAGRAPIGRFCEILENISLDIFDICTVYIFPQSVKSKPTFRTGSRPVQILSSLPAVSAAPLTAVWLVPFRLSKDFLKEAMAPVSVLAACVHPSVQTAAGHGCLIPLV